MRPIYLFRTIAIFLCTISALLLFHFQAKNTKHKTISFYHWKSTLNLSEYENSMLNELHTKAVYTKLFDLVIINGKAQPISILKITKTPNCPIIPCIFITNDVFKIYNRENIDTLALQIKRLVRNFESHNKMSFHEIILDCDWTPTTSTHFFSLIKKLQNLGKWNITSTLRLYQLKYPNKAGVPPVKQAYLMCYNMSPPQDRHTKNSIFDIGVFNSYTKDIHTYPIPLKISLPLFSWSCIFSKDEFKGFINNTYTEDFKNQEAFKFLSDNTVKCIKTINFKGKIINKGDWLRIEHVSENDLNTVIDQLSNKVATDTLQLIFYHLDEQILKQYENKIKF